MSFNYSSPVVYQPAVGPVQQYRPRQVMTFVETVSLAGSVWMRTVVDDLGLSQSDYHVESLSDDLSLISQASAVVGRVASASSAISFVQTNTVAGGRVDSGGGGGVETIDAVFDSTAAKGAVVYVSSNGHVDLAQANGEPQALAIGLAVDATTAGNMGEVITSGPFTNEDWNLTPGTVYYLDPSTPGGITPTYPSGVGDFVVILGAAVTPKQLNLEIHWSHRIGI